ncbi:MAG: hypothetical protein QOJ34_1689 [Pseudonocardiales bacterium]|nr:hypothetical protein [Pseudonocardiales bacterium]
MTRKTLLCVTVAALAAGASVAIPAAAASPATAADRYAVARRVCAAPAPGEKACYAVEFVPAARTTPGARPMATSAALGGPHGGFAPADLATAYGYDRNAATTLTVAIVDAYDDPKAKADLNAFNAHYGLPAETAATFGKVNQAGHNSPLPAADANWAVEITLDVQAVRAVCNQCRILLVEANSSSSFDLAKAVNTAVLLGADVISNSYGGPEQSGEPLWVRKAYNHPGVVITASTGDDGWYGWDRANGGPGPRYPNWSSNKPNTPAAYPTVVAVAGTKLTVNNDGSRAQETVWNENGPHDAVGLSGGFFHGAQGASGGGCSTQYDAPAWQSAVTGYSSTGCGTKRMAGDVAAVGDPASGFSIYDSYRRVSQDPWMVLGGTSLSSPVIAAMWALAGGAGSEKYPAKSLYDRLHYTPSAVSDVTIGSNAFCGGDVKATCSAALFAQIGTGNPNNILNGNNHYRDGWAGLLDCGYKRNGGEGAVAADKQCNATGGFDGPSGVGAPAGLTLFQPTRITLAVAAPAPVQLNTDQNWGVTDFADGLAGALVSNFKWNWGDGSVPTTVISNPTTHTFTHAGTFKVTVTATDNHGQQGSVSKLVSVGVAPAAVISGPTTVHAGQAATWRSNQSFAENTGASIVSRAWTVGSQQVATTTALTRTFQHVGSYTLKLTVIDDTGSVGTKSITVKVIR